ncbi:MAG: aldehyde dehydrogenase [Legionellales bacterium]|nr:aldehyde dehydrogenase [Legionellales bacterium]HBH11466.1 aldehyde dehydrogenase [Gammaproteobacteria bacterium]|tara:strand:+ start:98 stop:1534 length:1437 start_codon:yes stop_codon:yes gene_type:complete
MNDFPFLVANSTPSKDRLTVTAPWDQSVICDVPVADSNAVEIALSNAHTIFKDRDRWLAPYKRIEILDKTVEIMQSRFEELAIEAAREGGKPLIDSRVEVSRAIDGIKNCIECIRNETGRGIPMGLNAASQNRLAFTCREPIGVVVAVSAFNHPLNLIVHQVGPAVASGCPVIIKPAEDTPLSCFRFVQILHEAGLPIEYCQALVVNELSVAEQLVCDKRVGFFTFIGSGKVGWMLRSKLAPGTRCALEHGGVAPVIIDSTADLDDTLPLIAKGGFYHAGQVCVSVQRVFVPRMMANDVAKQLAELGEKMIIGDPTLEKTEVGPLIRTKEVDRVSEWIEEAKTAGATCQTGGKRLSDTTYACTVLLDPPSNVRISEREIFGPAICVYSYDEVDEAIELANSLPYSFQASILSRNLDFILRCNRRIDAATIMVNDHTAYRVDWMPFAGLKQSGYGVGGIPFTFEDMQIEKLTIVRSLEL